MFRTFIASSLLFLSLPAWSQPIEYFGRPLTTPDDDVALPPGITPYTVLPPAPGVVAPAAPIPPAIQLEAVSGIGFGLTSSALRAYLQAEISSDALRLKPFLGASATGANLLNDSRAVGGEVYGGILAFDGGSSLPFQLACAGIFDFGSEYSGALLAMGSYRLKPLNLRFKVGPTLAAQGLGYIANGSVGFGIPLANDQLLSATVGATAAAPTLLEVPGTKGTLEVVYQWSHVKAALNASAPIATPRNVTVGGWLAYAF